MRTYFRDWIENVETFVLEVIFEGRHDWLAKLARALLLALSKVFRVAIKVRRGVRIL
jgi:hypothetical protein